MASLALLAIATSVLAVNLNVSVIVNNHPPECEYDEVGVEVDIDTDPAAYPTVYRNESVVEGLFEGRYTVRDPYRRLEDLEDAGTKEFIHRLNNLSRPFFQRAPAHELIRQELTRQSSLPTVFADACISRHGSYYYYWGNQSVLYRRRELWAEGSGGDGEEGDEVFLDFSKLSSGDYSGDAACTCAAMQTSFSWDGTVAAYPVSEGTGGVGKIKVVAPIPP